MITYFLLTLIIISLKNNYMSHYYNQVHYFKYNDIIIKIKHVRN